MADEVLTRRPGPNEPEPEDTPRGPARDEHALPRRRGPAATPEAKAEPDPQPEPTTPLDHSLVAEAEKAAPSESGDDLPPFEALSAEYRVIRELGRGGMGVVHLVERHSAAGLPPSAGGYRLAVKRVAPGADLERLRNEARIMKGLDHPGIVSIHDVLDDGEQLAIVMELVDGDDLDAQIERDGPLAPDAVFTIASGVAEALAYAHDEGAIHRDVKPANILVDAATGAPKLTDFGLARAGTTSSLTTEATVLGTLDYMAPEQRRSAAAADARSDVYALGATIYRMLTGASPRVIRESLIADEQLREVILRCLEEDPRKRFKSMRELLHVLRRIQRTRQAEREPEPTAASSPFLRSFVRFLGDCHRALHRREESIDIRKDGSEVLPLDAAARGRIAESSQLLLTARHELEWAARHASSGRESAIALGALFVTGAVPDGESTRDVCAPLLTIPLAIVEAAGGRTALAVEEDSFEPNHALLRALGLEAEGEDEDAFDAGELPAFPLTGASAEAFLEAVRDRTPKVEWSDRLPLRAAGSTREEVGPDGLLDWYRSRMSRTGGLRVLPGMVAIRGKVTETGGTVGKELEAMANADLDTTSLAALYDPESYAPVDRPEPTRLFPSAALPMELSPAQTDAVLNARHRPISVVTGPPGTGKTHVIAAIVLDHILAGKTVLVGSGLEKAVEVAVDRITDLAGVWSAARSGGRRTQRGLAETLEKLASAPWSRARKSPAPSPARLELQTRDAELALARRDEAAEQLRAAVEAEREWGALARKVAALEREINGIAAGSDEGAELFPGALRDGLPGIGDGWRSAWVEPPHHRASRRASIDRARAACDRLDGRPGFFRRVLGSFRLRRAVRGLGVNPQATARAVELGLVVRRARAAVEMAQHVEHVLALEERFDELRAILGATPMPAHDAWRSRRQADEQLWREARRMLERGLTARHRALRGDKGFRDAVRRLIQALRRRDPRLKEELLQGTTTGLLTKLFPCWATTARRAGDILPVEAATFDLVVIDEASQCDLATTAPLLHRARRAVIVGDPAQLSHVCFLARRHEDRAWDEAELPRRRREELRMSRRSLFDVAADAVSPDAHASLDEHFRSHPSIVAFSNDRFYDGRLSVMTHRPGQEPNAVRWERTSGERLEKSTVNPVEVEAVRRLVKDDLVRDRPIRSIGVVSPFRDHADAIQTALIGALTGAEVRDHELVVGTAHGLQGDEKDVVVLATSVDPAAQAASLRFLQNPNVWNVAITRARHRLHVVTSVGPDTLPPGLLRDYLESVSAPVQAETWAGGEPRTHLAAELAEMLRPFGVVLTAFATAGTVVDVLLIREGEASLAIVCDGTDEDGEGDPLEELESLARAGYRPVRFSERAWLADGARVMAELGMLLES